MSDEHMSPEEAIRRPMPPDRTEPAASPDPQAFDTTRYTSDNLTFWVPQLIRMGQLTPATPLLDLGCGTGGFTLALQAVTGAQVVGVDVSFRLVQYAAHKPASYGLWWVQGHADALPYAEATFARVLLSLVLHQVPHRAQTLTEVRRILQPGGLVIIRTITPEAMRERIPFRFFPTMAEMEVRRLPTLVDLEALLRGAGFTRMRSEVVERHKAVDFQAVHTELQARPSYQALTAEERTHGLVAMREAWQYSAGQVVDPRPTLFMVGRKRGR
jgi:ubiquinone/menaquinone biosynthesis C-methylase UbiE